MTEVQDRPAYELWLPEAAIEDHLDRLEVTTVANAWSQDWFGFGAPGKPGRWQATPFPSEPMAVWTDNRAAGLWLSAKARSRIEQAMYGKPPPGDDLREIDRELFDAAVEKCVLDLCDRLVGGLALSRSGWAPHLGPPTYFTWPIADDVWVGLSRDTVIASARKAFGPIGPVRRLTSIESALAASSIEVGASLGKCALTIAEIASLASGDVLELDQTGDGLLDLVIDGRIAKGRACKLVAGPDSLKLQLA